MVKIAEEEKEYKEWKRKRQNECYDIMEMKREQSERFCETYMEKVDKLADIMEEFDIKLNRLDLNDRAAGKLSKLQIKNFLRFMAVPENIARIEQLKDINREIQEYFHYMKGIAEDNYDMCIEFNREDWQVHEDDDGRGHEVIFKTTERFLNHCIKIGAMNLINKVTDKFDVNYCNFLELLVQSLLAIKFNTSKLNKAK
jgi:hypothetical protein